ncbi:fluoride efflux transporter CrcB [Flavobacterium magnum]|uniref:Fluoride-specific ion channel FluC n=1 Tax=Flavobacterium magnum TaxID=2162713 RepID=A0A2S0RD08_9FLAO|nr:fluoride efflux transporter CrcB [Flavobacterium magnum]AWA29827.1 fluoride efflux transporter CrcB [Flavobacterium magnum]
MKIILAVGLGSFLGGISRYLLSGLVQAKTAGHFPAGTFTVNVVGCLLIGMVYAFADRGQLSTDWRLFLATGILGGFTTFSAFSYETFDFVKSGQYLNALLYIAGSIVLGVMTTAAGYITVTKYIIN